MPQFLPVIETPDVVENLGDATRKVGEVTKTFGNATKEVVVDKAVQYKDVYTTLNEFNQAFWERLPYLIIAVVIFVVFWLGARLFKIVVRKTLSSRAAHKQNLILVLNRIGSSVIVFVGFLIAMVIAIPGFTPGQLISTLGIGSVAIGFAFKDTFQNLLSGIMILLSEPFQIGDQIINGSFEGIVEDIQIRATYLRTYDGRRIVIPNSQLFTTPVTVNTAFSNRRIQTRLGIGCDDDVAMAKQVILDTIRQCPSVDLDRPVTVVLTELGEYTNNLMVRWWIKDNAQVDVTSSTDEVLSALKLAISHAGINLPYPTSQVRVMDSEGNDLPTQRLLATKPQPGHFGTAPVLPTAKSQTDCTRDPIEDSKPERETSLQGLEKKPESP